MIAILTNPRLTAKHFLTFLIVVFLSACSYPFTINQSKDIIKSSTHTPYHNPWDNYDYIDTGLTGYDIRDHGYSRFVDSVYLKHRVVVFGKTKGKPPVILLHELPGLGASILDYARTLAKGADGFTVYVPLLFGNLYEDFNLLPMAGLSAYLDKSDRGEWIRRDSLGGSTYLIQWLRKLVRDIASRHPDEHISIGIIGNCLTGALPLALLDHPRVKAVVLAQPTLPLKGSLAMWGEKELEISEGEWSKAKERLTCHLGDKNSCSQETTPARAYGVRFELDQIAPRAKHLWLAEQLGSGFVDREITNAEYVVRTPKGSKLNLCRLDDKAHSSLIHEWYGELMDEQPSERRRQEIRQFLRDPLGFKPESFADKITRGPNHGVNRFATCANRDEWQ